MKRIKATRENSKAQAIVAVYEILKCFAEDLETIPENAFKNNFEVGAATAIAYIIYKKELHLDLIDPNPPPVQYFNEIGELEADLDWEDNYNYGQNYAALMMRKLKDAKETLKLFKEDFTSPKEKYSVEDLKALFVGRS